MKIANRVSSSSNIATVAGKSVGVITELQSAWPGAVVSGEAYTLRGVTGDNLALHRALAEAEAGSILVAELVGETAAGHWGELMTIAAQARGIRGLIINATIRDTAQITDRRFPVFFNGTCPRPAGKDAAGDLGASIHIAGVLIEPGNLIVADDDGIAVVPRDTESILSAAAVLEERDRVIATRLAAGETTMAVLGLSR